MDTENRNNDMSLAEIHAELVEDCRKIKKLIEEIDNEDQKGLVRKVVGKRKTASLTPGKICRRNS